MWCNCARLRGAVAAGVDVGVLASGAAHVMHIAATSGKDVMSCVYHQSEFTPGQCIAVILFITYLIIILPDLNRFGQEFYSAVKTSPIHVYLKPGSPDS
jgi:hypothetical protein